MKRKEKKNEGNSMLGNEGCYCEERVEKLDSSTCLLQ